MKSRSYHYDPGEGEKRLLKPPICHLTCSDFRQIANMFRHLQSLQTLCQSLRQSLCQDMQSLY